MVKQRDYRRISILIHGQWGSGKSWLAASAPGPRLYLDTEGGVYDTPGVKAIWDPNKPLDSTGLTDPLTNKPFTAAVDKDTTVVVDVINWEVLEDARSVLRSGDHPFESVIIDSLHELQDQLKQAVAEPGEQYNPNATFEQRAWGRLLNNMAMFLRELRDLTRPGSVRKLNVILVAGSDDEIVPHKPMLEGRARKIVTGFYDVVGYLSEQVATNGDAVRVLQISPTPDVVAKCRLHNLRVKHGTQVINPDIQKMIVTVNSKVTA